jgi:hypothetical protein
MLKITVGKEINGLVIDSLTLLTNYSQHEDYYKIGLQRPVKLTMILIG